MWGDLSIHTKIVIRDSALGTLASPCKSARKGAAQAVAGIAALELPKSQWHEVIVSLVHNAQGSDSIFKAAALETLSYICEELDKNVLNQSEVDGILSVVVSSFSDSNEIKEIGLKTLQAMIPFCEKNLKVANERAILLNKIVENCKSEVEEVRLKAMICLLEVVKYFYDYIDNDGLDLIGYATIDEIKKKKDDNIGILAIEVWSSICDEEISRLKRNSAALPCQGYIRKAYPTLLPLLLEALENTSPDIDIDWDVPLTAMCCISLMAELLKDDILPIVISYTDKCFEVGGWNCTKAGIIAFASVVKGPNKEKINRCIIQALKTFLELLQAKEGQIRESVAWAFSKFTESNCEVFMGQDVFFTVITAFMVSLKDVPRVSNHICFAIDNLVNQLRFFDVQTVVIASVFLPLLKALWDNAFRGDAFADSVNLACNSFIAFSNLIRNVPENCISLLNDVFKMITEQFARTLDNTFPLPAHANDYQEYFCTALHPLFITFGPKMDSKLIEGFVNFILESFKQRSTAYDEGMYALSGLITSVKKAFRPFVERFGPYLIFSLKSINDTILCRVAIGCVSELAKALEEEIANHLKDLVPVLLDLLKNPEAEFRLKPVVIGALGDLAFFSTREFKPYLNDLLEILKSASILSLKLPEDVHSSLNL